ncbi:Radical-activating enzyme, conserved site [Acididesulfobacillus acetoxydans]|uniref:Pyruvate formate-lyase 2-activating enzyme n=1 Tax=Acididesulfobacillus acetoxydans TaxID=1561005 RepID=A0A8S0X3I0_9FIRM|nr:[formate-C-acetyltransferase]-activating enzyme [Acididesulfobacillus acetoxydans]CAA7600110.1 Radical-activating enzyme, conserved site [Acididesulfobacillus acetoxydans]CEJ07646.1 Pyruvate formate-lyase 2-activating enzyme [Acididesulfobacillus acetoxydans]
MRALIFNIQRYSIHDGGGIRTIVFFKGCPLHCPWCANPESQSFESEIMKLKSQCIHCNVCAGNAAECPSGALAEQGKWMSVDEVLAEVLKDSVFFNTSGGGVTLSGGEVLSQADFAAELLRQLKELGIHTAIETSGFGRWEALEGLAEYADVILYDLKIMDPEQSKKTLGADSEIILKNLAKLVDKGCRVIPRVPLIPGFTMDEKNITTISDLAQRYGLKEIHLLPFHQYGSSKYESLGRDYALKDLAVPTDEEVNAIKSKLEARGFMVVIGGG